MIYTLFSAVAENHCCCWHVRHAGYAFQSLAVSSFWKSGCVTEFIVSAWLDRHTCLTVQTLVHVFYKDVALLMPGSRVFDWLWVLVLLPVCFCLCASEPDVSTSGAQLPRGSSGLGGPSPPADFPHFSVRVEGDPTTLHHVPLLSQTSSSV